MKRVASLLLLPVVAASLSACSVYFNVSSSDVEAEVMRALTEKTGKAPDKIECPDDLKGKVGEKLTCKLIVGDEALPVDVTVTSVEGKDVKFDIQVGTERIK